MATTYFRVKNFEKYQHYKDRNPPWIKLYNDLFNDYEFSALDDNSKYHLLAINLLASCYSNKIPYDIGWIKRRINANSDIDLEAIENAGFIIKLPASDNASKVLADCKQNARLEEEETETDTSSYIGKNETGKLTTQILSIPSYPKSKKEVSDYLKKKLERYPAETIARAVEAYADKKKDGELLRTRPLSQLTTYIQNQDKWDKERNANAKTTASGDGRTSGGKKKFYRKRN